MEGEEDDGSREGLAGVNMDDVDADADDDDADVDADTDTDAADDDDDEDGSTCTMTSFNICLNNNFDFLWCNFACLRSSRSAAN